MRFLISIVPALLITTSSALGQSEVETARYDRAGSILERFGQATSAVENRLAPVPLIADLSITYVADAGNVPTRIARDPVDGHLYVTTMDGDVVRIDVSNPQQATVETVYTPADHGLSTHVLGMDFAPNGDLYLLGNIESTDHLHTVIKRGRREVAGGDERAWSVFLQSDDYLRSKTAFDHKASGLTISPDGTHAFYSSGSRTDHGEVHLGMREDELTAIIVRVPTSEEFIQLPNDRAALRESGYLFAEGIRNHFDLAFAPNGDLFATENAGDRDDSEEINWLREGHHYGFPWKIGSSLTPQQFPGFDREQDPFISRRATAWPYFYEDPTYPEPPEGVTFTDPVANLGPDADRFRDPETGEVLDGSDVGIPVYTMTSHRSPLGLVFDTEHVLAGGYTGDGFFLSWTGAGSQLLSRLGDEGEDLHHLHLMPTADNYEARITRIADGFAAPIDAVLVGTEMYVLEYLTGDVWRVSLPASLTATVTAELPDGYALGQNYPNPFNPSTRISFEIPQETHVRLTVLDALGRARVVALDRSLGAGRHDLSLSLDDLPSGVYFYRLEAAGQSMTRAMVLAR